ncbi:hypothetical protein MBAV_002349 [Candidatus Magnetobacterium bavaricum]|uniref:Uncharacterized protein n=1 Tax=Candidatus Magnetobacterium bavaricum TaxID=29290 RepID=A0A0F3GUF2_9BACT|nr:hypothetical protein MBAV_002349 [Candidatus Magnetobacterium bavaricum]
MHGAVVSDLQGSFQDNVREQPGSFRYLAAGTNYTVGANFGIFVELYIIGNNGRWMNFWLHFILLPLGDHSGKFGLRCYGLFHHGLACKFPHVTPLVCDLYIEHQLVAWDNRSSELGLLYAHEIDGVTLHAGLERKDTGKLRQRLYYQDTRHYRIVREMALKEGFIYRHVLYPPCAFAIYDLHNTVYHQERISVRQSGFYA